MIDFDETCNLRDFITQQPCQLEPHHEGFHDAGNGAVFAIGYSAEDEKEWVKSHD